MTQAQRGTESTDVSHPMPRSPADLFWSFSAMALQGFGGVAAVAQNVLVEKRRWLTREEFIGDWAVAQVLPGPNVVNLSLMIGDRHFGVRGAMAAMAGMLAFPMMLVLLLAALFSSVSDLPVVQNALRGMGAVIVGLIAMNALRLMMALRRNVMGRTVCAALILLSFLGMAWARLPLVWVIVVVGGAGWLWAAHRLARAQSAPREETP